MVSKLGLLVWEVVEDVEGKVRLRRIRIWYKMRKYV